MVIHILHDLESQMTILIAWTKPDTYFFRVFVDDLHLRYLLVPLIFISLVDADSVDPYQERFSPFVKLLECEEQILSYRNCPSIQDDGMLRVIGTSPRVRQSFERRSLVKLDVKNLTSDISMFMFDDGYIPLHPIQNVEVGKVIDVWWESTRCRVSPGAPSHPWLGQGQSRKDAEEADLALGF